jgi:exonuclease III
MVKENHPNILFLMETKCRKAKLELLRVKMGYEGLFVVDPVGRSGGLALFWRDDVDLEIQNFSRRHINSIVKGVDGESSWKLTSFYGHPNWSKRHESWALLRYLQSYRPAPWLVIGDFNEIMTQDEKYGSIMAREGADESLP